MKPRIILWTTMTVAVAAVALLLWFHRPAVKLSVKTRSPKQRASTVASSVAKAAPTRTMIATQPIHRAAQRRQPQRQRLSAAQTVVNGRADYQARQEAVQALATGKLSESNRELLYNFLRRPIPADSGQLGQVLKNHLMDVLCAMQPPPTRLGELLEQIYEDPGQNIVLRDYAVQHMAAYYRQMSAAQDVAASTRNDELKQTQQNLWAATGNTGSSIAGTALLGLTRLSQEGYPGFDQAKIADKALDLAGQYGSELTRITAFQVCASLDVKLALSEVLGAAQDGETEAVKISAIGALGALGGKAQISFLDSVLQGNDGRLRLSAQTAIYRIEQRLGLPTQDPAK